MSHTTGTPPGVHLEIMVPVIQFPRLPGQSAPPSPPTTVVEAAQSALTPTLEQVHLRPVDPHGQNNSPGDQGKQAEIAVYTTRNKLFRRFRFPRIPALVQPFRVLVSRRPSASHSGTLDIVDDQYLLAVSFASEADNSQIALQPAIHAVVILLDKEGIPVNYRVDGTLG
jgi:hypothetical protein